MVSENEKMNIVSGLQLLTDILSNLSREEIVAHDYRQEEHGSVHDIYIHIGLCEIDKEEEDGKLAEMERDSEVLSV